MFFFTINILLSYLILIVNSESGFHIQNIHGTSDSNVDLPCDSNKDDYLFLFWHFQDGNNVIGHSNSYDTAKYKFQTLSGNLTIRGLSRNDEGTYNCVSRGIRSDEYNIRSVKLKIAQGRLFENFDIKRDISFRMVVGGCIVLTCFIGCAGICVIRCFTKDSEYSSEPVPTVEDVESGIEEEKETALGKISDSFKSFLEYLLTCCS